MKIENASHTLIPPAGYWCLNHSAFAVLVHRRSFFVALGLIGLLFATVVLTLPLGSSTLTTKEAFFALFGEGTRGDLLLVQRLRLPRIIAALLCGFALGGAGCLVQTLSRNRLATPEILGQDSGASFAMTVFMMASVGQMLGPWWIASMGSMLVALLLLILAGGIGVGGHRVLIVGIGLTALMRSLTELLMTKTDLEHASAIYAWTLGSLEGQLYDISMPALLTLIMCVPFVLFAGRRLALMQFSDNIATTLGLNTNKSRLSVFMIGVFLASLAVGIGGPIPFVALAAPVISSYLIGKAKVPVICSGIVGALLVLLADTAGRIIASPGEIPAGVMTCLLGGPFLLWVILSDKNY